MDGLEAAEIILSKTSELSTFRIDSEYFLKRYLRYDELINKNPHSFTKLLDMGLTADASAFYPSLEPFYNCGEIPFIRVADVKNEVDYENCVKIPKMGAGFETLKLCKAGDIVLTKGGTIARAGLIKRDSYATRDLIFINSSKMSRDNYVSLFLLFCSKFMYDLMVKSSSQSVQPHLTITLIKDLPIFEFSEKFKKLLTSVYDLFEYSGVKSIELYKSAEKMLLDELGMSDFAPSTKAVAVKSFADSFGTSGRLDAEYYQPKYEEFGKILSKVPTHRVEDICTQINYGTVPTSPYTNDGTGLPYIKGMNLDNLCIRNTLDRITDTEDLPEKFYVRKGDIVISQMGTVGDVGVISDEEDGFLFASFTIRVRLKDFEKFNPLFVGLYIQNVAKEWYLLRNIAQASVRQNTDLPTIRNMLIPALDISVQDKIANMMQKSFALRRQSEQLLEIAKRAVEIAIEEGEEAAMEYIERESEMGGVAGG